MGGGEGLRSPALHAVALGPRVHERPFPPFAPARGRQETGAELKSRAKERPSTPFGLADCVCVHAAPREE
eukprot:6430606-Lingulodinium_polyedra.AAC.1